MPTGAKFFDTENLLCQPPERDVPGRREGAYGVEANSVKTRPQRAAIWRLILYCLGASALSAAFVRFLLRW